MNRAKDEGRLTADVLCHVCPECFHGAAEPFRCGGPHKRPPRKTPVYDFVDSVPVARARQADRITEAARALYEEVEMAESIGICLPDRTPSLILGAALCDQETDE